MVATAIWNEPMSRLCGAPRPTDRHGGRSSAAPPSCAPRVVPETRDDARHAVTHFTVLERFGMQKDGSFTASLLECRLETGRTHQIRVHMAHIGHPLIGDRDYGQAFRTKANKLPPPLGEQVSTFPRQALHARLLVFRHPKTHMLMRFEAPILGTWRN
jgi:23S rRNA pseudouridine1911/1915/1917 synthase